MLQLHNTRKIIAAMQHLHGERRKFAFRYGNLHKTVALARRGILNLGSTPNPWAE
jgi:hypothetical protein